MARGSGVVGDCSGGVERAEEWDEARGYYALSEEWDCEYCGPHCS